MWPIPVLVLGLLFVISAGRRLMPAREALDRDDDPTVEIDEDPEPG
jgi:hypothetical protein